MARTSKSSQFKIDPAHQGLDIYADDQVLTLDIWRDKYRYGDESHPFDSMRRVIEGVYAKDPSKSHKREALEAMQKGLWIPAGRIQAGAGTPNIVTLLNCYMCQDIDDSMTGIADALRDAMLTMQQGGGIGMNFSTLRPSGSYLRRTGAVASGPLPFMDMWNSMCATIMSAGSRRGAMMAVMDCEHPDLLDFITAKHEKGRLTNFNVSVLITDAFMDAVKEDEDWFLGFNVPRADGKHLFVTERDDGEGDEVTQWYAYSKWRARDLWKTIMENTYEWSEPGVIFIDRVNRENNLAYCETITGTNPCVTGDTLILTDKGHLPIESLVKTPVNIWNGYEWSKVVPFSTGVNNLYAITFTNGLTIRCTPYHKWLLHGDKIVQTHELKENDKLAYHDMPLLIEGRRYEIDAYSQGFYCGDGTRNATESNLYKHEQAIMDRLIGTCKDRNCKDQPGHRWFHGEMLPKDFVPMDGDLDYCLNWLAGYLDADGCVVKKTSTYIIEASAKDREFLQKVGLMLNRLSVNHRMWERKDSGMKKGSNGKEYMCESTAALMINKSSVHALVSLGMKCSRLDLTPFGAAPEGVARVGHRVREVRPLDYKEETFCVTEPLRGMCTFNGLTGPNCGEQPLPPNGCCNLGAVNLARMVMNPFTPEAEFDFFLLGQIAQVGTRFLDNVIDTTLYPLEAQAREEFAKRRIGVGITGLANALSQLGIRYGSDRAVELTKQIMRVLASNVYHESGMLAEERGSFPLYDEAEWGIGSSVLPLLTKECRVQIAKHGIRNGVLLTIAPTGTTSLYAGNVSSGLEPVFLHKAKRNVRQHDNTYKPYPAYDYGYRLYCSIKGLDPESKVRTPEYMPTHEDLRVSDHLEMQAACQMYVDASVSKTINCPEDMDFEQFQDMYEVAYATGCKGCTSYRPSEVRGSILSAPDEASSDSETKAAAVVRPDVLSGRTYKIKWPSVNENYYITINDVGGQPFEVFIQSTSSKYSDWTTALGLMISAIMRKGGDISFIPEELAKVRSADDSAYVEGKYYGSLVALIGDTIGKHLYNGDISNVEITPLDGTKNPRIEIVLDSSGNSSKSGNSGNPSNSGNPKLNPPRGETCPQCNMPAVIMREGCEQCSNCTYSRC